MSHHKKGEMKPDKAPTPDNDMKDTGAMQSGKGSASKASDDKKS